MDNIEDMGKYYQSYPVFRVKKQSQINNRIKNIFIQFLLSKWGKIVKKIVFSSEELNFVNCLIGLGVKQKSWQILDVGCGDGNWLQRMESIGFRNLCGIDKFVPENMVKSNCEFYKGEIFDMEGKTFDLITLHHSFEHMQNPEAVLNKISSLLNDAGICIIRIPVMGNVAWKKYKINWYQIDAPRHLFLYTEKAMHLLCEKAGFEIFDIRYDSQYGQFYVSEQYSKCKKSFSQICSMRLGEQDLKKYKRWARVVNMRSEGDQAIFYMRKR